MNPDDDETPVVEPAGGASDAPSETPGDAPSGKAKTAGIAGRLSRHFGTIVAVVIVALLAFLTGRLGSDRAAGPPDEEPTAAHDHTQVWTCSMHPQIRMNEPGQCPVCGMDLVPTDPVAEMHGPVAPRVTLSAQARALAAIRTSAVVRTEPRAEVRLLGRVDLDETRLRMITPWTDGRIDRLKVRVTGARVRKGQVVASLYSPEVYAAMRDVVVAAKQADRLSKGMHGSADLASAALGAAREKLRLLGVSDAEIKSIERTRKAPKVVSVRSSFSGTVLRRMVEQGDYVKAGTVLYHVADLSRVWVQIDAYESDLPHLRVGQTVTVEIDSLPGESFAGAVAFIDPVIHNKTRTARVRVEVANTEGRLRPGMFAQALVDADVGGSPSHLVIPSSAALFTGRRSVVYVEVPGEPGSYELREVRLGPRAGPVFPVLAGLSEGELVVTHGAFVLDADLQLDGGRSMMTRPDDRAGDPVVAVPITAAMLVALAPVVVGYLDAQESLSDDDFPAARSSLDALAASANAVQLSGPRAATEAWQPIASKLAGHARHAAKAKNEGEVRTAFEHVSGQVGVLLRTFGNPTKAPIRVAYCPMAFDNRGAQWVQRDTKLANPYYGAAMLTCGEFRATVLPGERLAATGQGAPASPAAMAGHNH